MSNQRMDMLTINIYYMKVGVWVGSYQQANYGAKLLSLDIISDFSKHVGSKWCILKLQHWQRKSIHFSRATTLPVEQVCFETSGNFPKTEMWHLHSFNAEGICSWPWSKAVSTWDFLHVLFFYLHWEFIWWNLRCIGTFLFCNHDVVFKMIAVF